MAKRFTDTNKYKKSFIRCLPGAYKLLWDYLYHDCDHAGLWIVDFEVAQIYLGADMKVNKQDALKYFNEGENRIIEVSKNIWFIPSFIEFQYGQLNPENRAHNSIIKALDPYNLLDSDFKIKGLESTFRGAKDKDMDKYKDKETDKDKIKDARAKKNYDVDPEFPEYKDSMKAYFDFYKAKTGVNPSIKTQDGAALKKLILHFRGMTKEGQSVVEGLIYIFNHWQKLDDFTQKQIDISKIYTNINSIISQLKTPKKNANTNTGNTDYDSQQFRDSMFAKIDKAFAGKQ